MFKFPIPVLHISENFNFYVHSSLTVFFYHYDNIWTIHYLNIVFSAKPVLINLDHQAEVSLWLQAAQFGQNLWQSKDMDWHLEYV